MIRSPCVVRQETTSVTVSSMPSTAISRKDDDDDDDDDDDEIRSMVAVVDDEDCWVFVWYRKYPPIVKTANAMRRTIKFKLVDILL